MSGSQDTIAAVATPPGRGGIGIVRVSGPAARDIATAILGSTPIPRKAELEWFRDADGEILDKGLAIFFPAPHSYTGEDVLELQGHGGPVVMDVLLKTVTTHGARLARPGEFSERAFLNDKLDLAQAEAIADLIDSASTAAARAAARSLHGEFSQQIIELVAALTELRVHVEAAIDFPEEEIDFLGDRDLKLRLANVLIRFRKLREQARVGALLRDGMTVVLAGRPNAGKSSLMNRLAGYDAAIVTARPGTTRDVLREDIQIDGLPLKVVDTAGLRDVPDEIEREGVRRARAAMANADLVLYLCDATREGEETLGDQIPAGVPVAFVRNKIDLTGETPGVDEEDDRVVARLSALTGAGVDELRDYLRDCVGFTPIEGTIIARRRHVDALERAFAHVRSGAKALRFQRAGELMAEELRLAQQDLGEITGRVTSDELLGRIFQSFCIGK